jgi:hypothetical protein
MMMMCKKWQHDQPFPERCSQNDAHKMKQSCNEKEKKEQIYILKREKTRKFF